MRIEWRGRRRGRGEGIREEGGREKEGEFFDNKP